MAHRGPAQVGAQKDQKRFFGREILALSPAARPQCHPLFTLMSSIDVLYLPLVLVRFDDMRWLCRGGVQPSGGIGRDVFQPTGWLEKTTTTHGLVGAVEDKDERWRGAAQSIPLDRFVSGNLYRCDQPGKSFPVRVGRGQGIYHPESRRAEDGNGPLLGTNSAGRHVVGEVEEKKLWAMT